MPVVWTVTLGTVEGIARPEATVVGLVMCGNWQSVLSQSHDGVIPVIERHIVTASCAQLMGPPAASTALIAPLRGGIDPINSE